MDRDERIKLEEIRDDLNRLAVALVDVRQDVNALLDAPDGPPLGEPVPWLAIARRELGVREIRGDEHNPRVLEYHDTTGLSADDDETPWCSSFVNWCIEQAGLTGTNSARARSWEHWGDHIDEPIPGCIAVLWRGSPSSRKGHVAFYVGESDEGVSLLGGNMTNSVKISTYDRDRILTYRMPG